MPDEPTTIAERLEVIGIAKSEPHKVWYLQDPVTGKEYYAKTCESPEIEATTKAAKAKLPENSPVKIVDVLTTRKEDIPKVLKGQVEFTTERTSFLIVEAAPKGIALGKLAPDNPRQKIPVEWKETPITAAEYEQVLKAVKSMNEQGVYHHDLSSNTNVIRGDDGKLKVYIYDFEPHLLKPLHPEMPRLEDYAQMLVEGKRLIGSGALKPDAVVMLNENGKAIFTADNPSGERWEVSSPMDEPIKAPQTTSGKGAAVEPVPPDLNGSTSFDAKGTVVKPLTPDLNGSTSFDAKGTVVKTVAPDLSPPPFDPERLWFGPGREQQPIPFTFDRPLWEIIKETNIREAKASGMSPDAIDAFVAKAEKAASAQPGLEGPAWQDTFKDCIEQYRKNLQESLMQEAKAKGIHPDAIKVLVAGADKAAEVARWKQSANPGAEFTIWEESFRASALKFVNGSEISKVSIPKENRNWRRNAAQATDVGTDAKSLLEQGKLTPEEGKLTPEEVAKVAQFESEIKSLAKRTGVKAPEVTVSLTNESSAAGENRIIIAKNDLKLSAAELKAVAAHEMGHVLEKHAGGKQTAAIELEAEARGARLLGDPKDLIKLRVQEARAVIDKINAQHPEYQTSLAQKRAEVKAATGNDMTAKEIMTFRDEKFPELSKQLRQAQVELNQGRNLNGTELAKLAGKDGIAIAEARLGPEGKPIPKGSALPGATERAGTASTWELISETRKIQVADAQAKAIAFERVSGQVGGAMGVGFGGLQLYNAVKSGDLVEGGLGAANVGTGAALLAANTKVGTSLLKGMGLNSQSVGSKAGIGMMLAAGTAIVCEASKEKETADKAIRLGAGAAGFAGGWVAGAQIGQRIGGGWGAAAGAAAGIGIGLVSSKAGDMWIESNKHARLEEKARRAAGANTNAIANDFAISSSPAREGSMYSRDPHRAALGTVVATAARDPGAPEYSILGGQSVRGMTQVQVQAVPNQAGVNSSTGRYS